MKRLQSLAAVGLFVAGALAVTPALALTPQHAGPPRDEAPHAASSAEHAPSPTAEPLTDAKDEASLAEHGEHAPGPINWFDFSNKEQPPYGAMLINFAILMVMYWSLGRKPIGVALKNRRATIAKEIEEAQRMRKEAEDRALKYQDKLKHLEEELKETRAALVEAGKADRDRIIRDAEEKATRMEKDAVFLVEQEMKQLRQDLTREAVELAVSAAEELLRKRVTPVDQERLAEDYLAELASKKSSASVVAARAVPPPPQQPPPPASGGQS